MYFLENMKIDNHELLRKNCRQSVKTNLFHNMGWANGMSLMNGATAVYDLIPKKIFGG